jgi:hypothetical protein
MAASADRSQAPTVGNDRLADIGQIAHSGMQMEDIDYVDSQTKVRRLAPAHAGQADRLACLAAA